MTPRLDCAPPPPGHVAQGSCPGWNGAKPKSLNRLVQAFFMPCANAPRFDRTWRDANIRSSAVELNAIRCQGSVRANSSEARPLCAIPRKSKLPTRSSGATIDFDEFVNRYLYHPISARPLTSRAPDLSFSASDGGPAAVIAEAVEKWDKRGITPVQGRSRLSLPQLGKQPMST